MDYYRKVPLQKFLVVIAKRLGAKANLLAVNRQS
jgi:hypothetical protein